MSPEKFLNVLGQAEAKLAQASFRGPLVEAARAVNKAVEGNFQREESSDGVSWAPHAPLTIALHGPHPLLRLSYDMFKASTNLDDPNAKRIISDREITFGVDGTEIPYAHKQQHGQGRIPAREFFYLREEDSDEVASEFGDAAQPIIIGEVLS